MMQLTKGRESLVVIENGSPNVTKYELVIEKLLITLGLPSK